MLLRTPFHPGNGGSTEEGTRRPRLVGAFGGRVMRVRRGFWRFAQPGRYPSSRGVWVEQVELQASRLDEQRQKLVRHTGSWEL